MDSTEKILAELEEIADVLDEIERLLESIRENMA